MRGSQRSRFLNRGVRERRLVGPHHPVQIRSPRPGFTPVADRASGIACLRFTERPHGLRLGEGIGQLEPLVEKRLRLAVLRGNWPRERAQGGLVEIDAPAKGGRRCAVVRMLAGHEAALRLDARIRETTAAPTARDNRLRSCLNTIWTIPHETSIHTICCWRVGTSASVCHHEGIRV